MPFSRQVTQGLILLNAVFTSVLYGADGEASGPIQPLTQRAPIASEEIPSTPRPNPAIPTPPTGNPATSGDSFWGQDTLTGDWKGLRKKLEDDGFKVTPTYTALVIGNPSGGARQGVVSDGLVNLALDFDLEKMTAGDVDGLIIHANALYLYGPSLSKEDVGDLSGTTSISGYNTIRLQELWLEKSFLNQRLSIRIGNMAVDNEFFQSPSSALFVNNTFVDFALFGDNIINAPLFPVASPGVRLKLMPTSNTYVMAGVYGMDNSSNQAAANQNGTRFALTASSGILIMSEAGYLLNQAPNEKGLQGTYRVGSFVHTANYDTWGSQAEAANGTGALKSGGANYGVYGLVDQQLFSRENDVAGLAFAHSDVGSNYSDSQVLQGNAPYTSESFIETTYKIQVAPWWSIQPDVQYYFNPSGQQGSPDAVVLGLRPTVTF
jgi:porin